MGSKNICIVGCGRIGRLHARNLSKSCSLFFHSRSEKSAEKLNQSFGGRGVLVSFQDVLNSADIDAVVICSPPEFHKEQIIRALRAGKSVLVEKPMCVSAVELDEIEKVLRESPRDHLLMVAENYYYKPGLKKIKQLLRERRIGEIRSIFVTKRFSRPTCGWRSRHGALLEGGIHFIALISDILNDSPWRVTARFAGPMASGVERNSTTNLEYGSQTSAQLVYSWDKPSLTKGVFQHSYIQGDRGKIIFESNGLYVVLKSAGKTHFFLSDPCDLLGYRSMTNDFLACLEFNGRMPYSDFSKAKRDLSIVFGAYEYLDTG